MALNATNAPAQNIMINVLTHNSGVVKKGETVFFEVTINNTSATTALAEYKIRPQISFPTAIISIPDNGHVLPEGWRMVVKENGVVTLSNGTDMIPENTSRTILIAMKAVVVGGPTTINGNLFFSTGIEPGTLSGVAPKGDNIADNFSTSTVRVL